jgi:hypothetical protein
MIIFVACVAFNTGLFMGMQAIKSGRVAELERNNKYFQEANDGLHKQLEYWQKKFYDNLKAQQPVTVKTNS